MLRVVRRRPPTPKLDFSSWIVFEDDWLVAVDKPAGVLSQGADRSTPSVVSLARAYLDRGGIGVLHRIDRNVSGVVLVAKHARAARAMTALFAKGEVRRAYRAIVLGAAPTTTLTIDAAIAKDRAKNQVRVATARELARLTTEERAAFKPAVTRARVLRRLVTPAGEGAELEVLPETGRPHQIRAHLAHVGLPILGDPKYGAALPRLDRPLLHAEAVRFVHPKTKAAVEVRAAVPWQLARLGIRILGNGHR